MLGQEIAEFGAAFDDDGQKKDRKRRKSMKKRSTISIKKEPEQLDESQRDLI